MTNGKSHTTAWLTLLGALMGLLMIGGQVFLGVQQNYTSAMVNDTSATVNNPDSGILHQHQMIHKRIVELEQELEELSR